LSHRGKQAVESAEAFSDGQLSEESLRVLWEQNYEDADVLVICSSEEDGERANDTSRAFNRAAARAASPNGASYDRHRFGAFAAALSMAKKPNKEAPWEPTGNAPLRSFASEQARVMRDIVGNPFGPIDIDRTWRTPTVTSLATAIYEERQLPSGLFDNSRLAILADALEETGCDNAGILDHLRNGGDHVRGCHVIDLILGKE
jgi:hypothetical protein